MTALAPWTALAAGDAVSVPAGSYLAIVASVKASHTEADLFAFAHAHGLSIVDYAEQGERAGLGPDPRSPGYRYVAAIASSPGGVDLPWSVPWPLSMVDGSTLVSAWTSPATPIVPAAPPLPSPSPAPAMKTWQRAAVGAAVGAALGQVIWASRGPNSPAHRQVRALRRVGRSTAFARPQTQWALVGAAVGALLVK